MMLHEKPDQLVQSSIDSFEIEPDLLTIQRIHDNVEKAAKLRRNLTTNIKNANDRLKHNLSALQSELSELTKVDVESLDGLLSADDLQAGNGNVFTTINRKLQALDNEKLSLAKKLNEYESKTNSLSIEKARLQETLQQLNIRLNNLINANILNNPNSNVIKINLYKSFGVSIDLDQEEDRILVVNHEGLTSILKVEDKYSEYFVSNWIWDRI